MPVRPATVIMRTRGGAALQVCLGPCPAAVGARLVTQGTFQLHLLARAARAAAGSGAPAETYGDFMFRSVLA